MFGSILDRYIYDIVEAARVRVRYPQLRPHYGRRTCDLAKPAGKAVMLGVLLRSRGPGADLPVCRPGPGHRAGLC